MHNFSIEFVVVELICEFLWKQGKSILNICMVMKEL